MDMAQHPGFVVPPKSRKDIIQVTKMLRSVLNIDPLKFVDIADIVENRLSELIPDYSFEIRDEAEMRQMEGVTLFHQNTIILREDVARRLVRHEKRARFTAAHEVGHLILGHNLAGFARTKHPDQSVPLFQDGEWQANTFAGTLLLSPEMAKEAGFPVSAALMAQMSDGAAEVTFKHYQREGLLT